MSASFIALWAVVLVLQNASFTIVSRARNSGSDWYHATAAVFSNGIWFVSNGMIIFNVTAVIDRGSKAEFALLLAVYIVCTVFGSVVAGKFARRYMEKGKRRVGHYEKGEG